MSNVSPDRIALIPSAKINFDFRPPIELNKKFDFWFLSLIFYNPVFKCRKKDEENFFSVEMKKGLTACVSSRRVPVRYK
jgi:hypothetical protein